MINFYLKGGRIILGVFVTIYRMYSLRTVLSRTKIANNKNIHTYTDFLTKREKGKDRNSVMGKPNQWIIMDTKIEKDKANCIYMKANFISLAQTEVFSADGQVLTHLFYAT